VKTMDGDRVTLSAYRSPSEFVHIRRLAKLRQAFRPIWVNELSSRIHRPSKRSQS
jgi:hypothetical protein